MTTAAATDTIESRVRRMTPVTAPPEERTQVEELSRELGSIVQLRHAQAAAANTGCELVGPSGKRLPIPEAVFYALERVVEVMARGDSITIVPVGREVTTQQAADLLNVSRQYLVRLLDDGKIRHRKPEKPGKHRRLRIEDVLAYKQQRDRDRRAGLRELTRLTEELGGYDAERAAVTKK